MRETKGRGDPHYDPPRIKMYVHKFNSLPVKNQIKAMNISYRLICLVNYSLILGQTKFKSALPNF